MTENTSIRLNNRDRWLTNYDALKAHVAITGHFPDKHSTLNNWVRYQRKRTKAYTLVASFKGAESGGSSTETGGENGGYDFT